MMRLILLFSALFMLAQEYTCEAKTYYVSTSGSNSNAGTGESSPWATITYAASKNSPVVAGDTVYVKSGNYGSEEVSFQKSGTADKPISFIGYKSKPGDAPLLLVNAKPYTAFSESEMPLFDGKDRSDGIGFYCENQSYLVLKNFQIQNYAYGVMAGARTQTFTSNLYLYNVNTMYIGDISSSYAGYGFLFGSMGTKFASNNILENCLAVNAAAEGFGINGDKNTLQGCKVYCNENEDAAATDYYILICGNDNTVKECYIERTPGLSHNGHGITVKSNAEQVIDDGMSLPVINPQNNKILNCVARNMGESFCVRHRGVQNNIFSHCKAIGTYSDVSNSGKGEGNCVVIRDGASNNIFDGCIAENCNTGVKFMDTVEDGDTDSNPTGHPGNNNLYINCLIYNCYSGVKFDEYSIESDAGDNTIANCTFYKCRFMLDAERRCANMKYVGNIFYGVSEIKGSSFTTGSYKADILPNTKTTFFQNCDFFNLGTGIPTDFIKNAASSISADPLFNDPASFDFHLNSKSPCVDASIDIKNVTNDHDSLPRHIGKGVDIGAFEYNTGGVLMSITRTITNVKCNGGKDGSARITVNGGKSPYQYLWNNGQTGSIATGLVAGIYTVTVTDSTLTAKKFSIEITQPSVNINSVISKSNVSTYGGRDGEFVMGSEGGTAPYSYLWTPNNQTTATASGLTAGNYFLKVTDANGCIATRTLTITQPFQSTATFKITTANLKCNGANDGTATVTASGGKTPYTYLWSNGQTNALATGLKAGNYEVNVTDTDFSSKIITVSITEPTAIAGKLIGTNPTSCTANNGTIKVTTSGGGGNYTYKWNTNPVQTTGTATGLAVGKYSVTITDANGCTSIATASITCVTNIDNTKEEESSFLVYPNPTSGEVNIVSHNINNEITVFDFVGRVILSKYSSSSSTKINLKENENGIYFIRIRNNDSSKTIRVILNK